MILNILRIYDAKLTFIFADSQGNILSQSEKSLIYTHYSEIKNCFPRNFNPIIIYFHFPEYYFIPIGIEKVEATIFALISDWNLNFILLKDYIKVFDYIFTDLKGVKVFKNHDFNNVSYFPLFPLQVSSYEKFNQAEKIYDMSFIGNLNDDIQVERAKYLYKIAKMSYKYKINLTSNIYGDEYRQILSQSKIIFNLTIRSELNIRVFEAMNARSLLLLEEDNQEAEIYFKSGIHFVSYNENNLEEKIDFYLNNNFARNKIIDNAYEFVLKHNQQYFEKEIIIKMIFLANTKTKKRILNENNILKSALMSVQSGVYENTSKIYQIHVEDKESINLLLANEFKNNNLNYLDYLKYLNLFPQYIPLQINHLKYMLLSKLSDEKIIAQAIELTEFIINENLAVEDLSGFIIDEKFSRFAIEYEKASANKSIEDIKNAFLYLLYNLIVDLEKEQNVKIMYLEKANQIFQSAKIKLAMGNIYEENNLLKAYDYYLKALKISPFNWDTIYYLDNLAQKLSVKPENQEWFTIIDSSPLFKNISSGIEDYEIKYLEHKKALIKKYQNEKNIIFHLITKIPQYVPDTSEDAIIFANTYYQFKNYKSALDLLAKFIKLTGKKDKVIIQMIGECLKELGDNETLKKLTSP